MATTLEILLTTTFDSTGLNQASTKIRELAENAKGQFFEGGDLLESGNFDTAKVEEFAKSMNEVSESMREQAIAAANMNDFQLADQHLKQSQAAKALSQQYKELAGPTGQQVIRSFTQQGQSLTEMVKALDKAVIAEKKLAAAALQNKNKFDADIHKQRAKAIEAERQEITKLNKELRASAAMEKFQKELGDTNNLKEFEKKVKDLRQELRDLKTEALKTGDNITEVMALSDEEAQLQKLASAVLGNKRTFELFGEELGVLGKIMTSTFNQFGFVMFVTTNTVKSIIGIFKSLAEQIDKLATREDQIRLLGAAFIDTGENINEFSSDLREASTGFVEYEEAMKGVLRLIVRAGQEFAGFGREALDVARKLEVLTGGVEQATDTYNALVDAIVDGDVDNVTNITGFEDLDDAVEIARWRVERLGGEFSDLDAESLAVNLVTDRVSNLNDELDDISGGAGDLRSAWSSVGDTLDAMWTTLGLGLGVMFQRTKDVHEETEGLGITAKEVGGWLVFGFLAPITAIKGMAEAIWELQDIASDFMQSTVKPMAMALQGDFTGAWEAYTELLGDFASGQTLKEMKDSFVANIEETVDDITRLGETVQDIVAGTAMESAEAVNEAFDSLAMTPERIRRLAGAQIVQEAFGDILEALKFLEGPAPDFLEGLDKQALKSAEKIADIEDKFSVKMDKLNEKRTKARLEAQDDFNDKSAELEEDLGRKIEDINGDLDVKTSRIREDAFEKREREKAKSAKKLEDIEEDHQKKLKDIMRKFDLDRLKSLIDRDARGLYEAERRRDEELRKENEAAKKKKEDEIENNNDRLMQMAEDEAKALRRAYEDAEKRRKEARESNKLAMDDLQDWLEERREEIFNNYQDERNDARAERTKALNEEKNDNKKRLKEIKDNFQATQDAMAAAKLQEDIIMLSNLDPMAEGYKEMFQSISADREQWVVDGEELLERMRVINEEMAGGIFIPSLGGGDDGGDPGGSDPGDGCAPGYNPNFNPTLGGVCGQVASTTVITACDGSKWQCYNGNWIPAGTVTADTQTTGVGVQKTLNGLPSSGGTNIVADSSGRGGGSNGNQVTIVVEGDKTLEQIFREISFSAYIETITP